MSKDFAKNLARAAVNVKESGKVSMMSEGSKRRLKKIAGMDKEESAASAAAAKAKRRQEAAAAAKKRDAARAAGNQIPKKRKPSKPSSKSQRVEYTPPRTTDKFRKAAAKRKESQLNPATREVLGWKKARDEKVGKVKSLLNAFGLGKK